MRRRKLFDAFAETYFSLNDKTTTRRASNEDRFYEAIEEFEKEHGFTPYASYSSFRMALIRQRNNERKQKEYGS